MEKICTFNIGVIEIAAGLSHKRECYGAVRMRAVVQGSATIQVGGIGVSARSCVNACVRQHCQCAANRRDSVPNSRLMACACPKLQAACSAVLPSSCGSGGNYVNPEPQHWQHLAAAAAANPPLHCHNGLTFATTLPRSCRRRPGSSARRQNASCVCAARTANDALLQKRAWGGAHWHARR